MSLALEFAALRPYILAVGPLSRADMPVIVSEPMIVKYNLDHRHIAIYAARRAW
jgi:hypothetical protein